ncbi:hypothetical protein ACNOYE_11485 [Nannocystaceae bacterium ST9]
MAERRVVLVLGLALAGCTAHGDLESAPESSELAHEPDRFAWVDEFELPRDEHDPALRFASAAIECSRVEPWRPPESLEPSSAPDFEHMVLLYGDRPGLAGFNLALGLPLAAEPSVSATFGGSVFPSLLSWSFEGRRGHERITWEGSKPSRIDGFDDEGRWQRTALFQHGPRMSRRVEFRVDAGAPVRERTYVFDRDADLLLAMIEHVEHVEQAEHDRLVYRRWRVDRGEKSVVFEQHPDRVVRRAQIYERGVAHERVDELALREP